MKRLVDPVKFLEIMSGYLPVKDLDPESWIENTKNIALVYKDNLALFQYEKEGFYTGHFFYNSARGKRAVSLSKEFLNEFLLSGKYSCKIITGLTPLRHLGARWLSKSLGFKSNGIINTPIGYCELFILTKKDWESLNHE